MLFSIVIPVYKVEKYLAECLDSVLSQSFKDYEIVLVDDGSPDNCPVICDEYASKHPNIKVIHKKNGGLSDARNTGIKNSSGEYCMFIDSDDKILHESLLKLSGCLTNSPDVLITQMLNDTKMENIEPYKLFDVPSVINKYTVIKHIFKQRDHEYTSPAQQYIVKREFILKNKLCFEVGRLHEDVKWTANLIVLAETFSFYNYLWYLRRSDNADSIMSHISSKNVIDEIEIVSNEIHSDLYSGLNKKTRKIVFSRLMQTMFSQFSNIGTFDKDSKEKIACLLDDNKDILVYSKKTKHKIFSFIIKCFGGHTAVRILSKVYKK